MSIYCTFSKILNILQLQGGSVEVVVKGQEINILNLSGWEIFSEKNAMDINEEQKNR